MRHVQFGIVAAIGSFEAFSGKVGVVRASGRQGIEGRVRKIDGQGRLWDKEYLLRENTSSAEGRENDWTDGSLSKRCSFLERGWDLGRMAEARCGSDDRRWPPA